MCGLAGFVDFAQPLSTLEELLRMKDSLRHRGPNDSGHFYEPGVGLCHTRLSIIDLSQKAHQPMQRKQLTLVYNGEIYNFPELRRELQKLGHSFESHSDTEVVLAAYAEWGAEAVGRFNGMFALAIYDPQNKKLFLARDQRGIKPLYYYFDGQHFIFASEMTALTKSAFFRKNISLQTLGDYLHFGYALGENAIWENCQRLLPGHHLTVDLERKDFAVSRYWAPWFSGDQPGDFAMIKSDLKSILIDEFRQSTVSDVPVGVCISGGVDSNVLISLLAKEAGMKLKTYSLSSLEAAFDENKQATAVARYLGTDHTNLVLDPSACRELFLETVAHYDGPFADQNILSFRFIAQQAKKDGVKVLLSGAGGDELFMGYPRVIAMANLKYLFAIPLGLRNMISKSVGGFSNYLYKGMHVLQQPDYLSALSCIEGNCFFKDEVNALLPQARYVDNYFNAVFREVSPVPMTLVDKIMRCDMLCYLPANILRTSDMSTMAEGVEMRVPYLNNGIVDLALKIPTHLKKQNGKFKAFLRAIEREYLPEEILSGTKRGFYPFVKNMWLKDQFKDLVDKYLSEDRIRKQGIFDYQALQKIVTLGNTSSVKVDNKIWNMLIFQIWAESHL